MLDIRDMSEKDKLFTFMEGLRPWACLERQRQRVIDLGLAIAAAKRLTDFNLENRRDRQTTSNPVEAKKTVPPRAGKTATALSGSHSEEEAQPPNPQKKGLIFVDVKIHGKPIRAMIDTGATHNYLVSVEVEGLGLVLEKGVGE
ncbi:UNVERIFIED_CONTAM: hypothetical protein Slati_1402100 [Sesamum latifolium]|uniref:Gag-pol polyprotein n=1 Tax=Sesamum latifolium TaxID=2727402 RepID=A0AAW2X6T1_9LAMI